MITIEPVIEFLMGLRIIRSNIMAVHRKWNLQNVHTFDVV